MFKNVTIIVDGVLCPIQRHVNTRLEEICFSGKNLRNCYNYQAVTSAARGKFVNWYGPSPGTFNDLQVLHMSGLADQVEAWEVVLGDKIYSSSAEPITMLTPVPRTRGALTLRQQVWNNLVGSVRCGIECALGRLKRMKILCESPHLHTARSHQEFFFIALNFANIDIDLHPLRGYGPPSTLTECPLGPVLELDNIRLLSKIAARERWRRNVRAPFLHLLPRSRRSPHICR